MPEIARTKDWGASADLVRAYLNGIGRTRLLNAEQEVDPATKIEAGLFADEQLTLAGERGIELDPQLRADLRTITTEGRAAKNHLLEANLRLVVSIAKPAGAECGPARGWSGARVGPGAARQPGGYTATRASGPGLATILA